MSNIQPYAKGSLVDTTGGQASPQQTALALMKSKMLILCDISGSMAGRDAELDGEVMTRHGAAQAALDAVQEGFPGKVAVAAFCGNGTGLVPNGKLPSPQGDTPLFQALTDLYPKAQRGNKKFVVVSDGEPTDDKDGCLTLAESTKYPINTIYVGNRREGAEGRMFMEKLAAVSGGTHDIVDLKSMKLLEKKLVLLLTAEAGVQA